MNNTMLGQALSGLFGGISCQPLSAAALQYQGLFGFPSGVAAQPFVQQRQIMKAQDFPKPARKKVEREEVESTIPQSTHLLYGGGQ